MISFHLITVRKPCSFLHLRSLRLLDLLYLLPFACLCLLYFLLSRHLLEFLNDVWIINRWQSHRPFVLLNSIEVIYGDTCNRIDLYPLCYLIINVFLTVVELPPKLAGLLSDLGLGQSQELLFNEDTVLIKEDQERGWSSRGIRQLANHLLLHFGSVDLVHTPLLLEVFTLALVLLWLCLVSTG